MSVFFTCIILIGSAIAVFALFLIMAEKKRLYDYRREAAEKKDELIGVIEDAELLIDEMNKFSDFAVSNLEQKNTELRNSIEGADLRIEALNGAAASLPESVVANSLPENSAEVFPGLFEKAPDEEMNVAAIIDSQLLKKGKVIPFDVKRREIIKLSKGGLDSAQIARMLKMGRGEIELIEKMGR